MNRKQLFQRNRAILHFAADAVYDMRRQNFDGGIRRFQSLISYVQLVLNEFAQQETAMRSEGIAIEVPQLLQLLTDIMQAQEDKDYILLADLLELTLIPFFVSFQDMVRTGVDRTVHEDFFEVNLAVLRETDAKLAHTLEAAYAGLRQEKDRREFASAEGVIYCLEDTQFGFTTLKIIRDQKSYYLHSNNNPYEEGKIFADTFWTEESEAFHVLGAGYLYHALFLAEKKFHTCPVHVYEADCNVLALSMIGFSLENVLRSHSIILHYDALMQEFSKAITKNPLAFAIHYPSLRNIVNTEVRQSLEKFFISENSIRVQLSLLQSNFKSNTRYLQEKVADVDIIDRILPQWTGKTVYIAAAGPSLDKNIALLRERRADSILLATGTVFRKLMKLGIRPDYVLITDPNERVLPQIREFWQEDVPMLLLVTANKKFLSSYAGKKYLIFQRDFPQAEEMAGKKGITLFETGGSVSTTALDAAIRAQAACIIFVGLDLAFTGNLAHAEGTSNRVATEKDDLMPVKAFDGKEVLTDSKFTIYREWIERRIAVCREGSIRMINATEGGAYIKGMTHMTLQEAMRQEQKGGRV